MSQKKTVPEESILSPGTFFIPHVKIHIARRLAQTIRALNSRTIREILGRSAIKLSSSE